MDFQPTYYLEFVKGTDFSGAECNLAFSGIDCPYSLAELGITSRILESKIFHGYGTEELKSGIARRYGVEPEQVLVPGGGSSLSNFLFAASLLGPGDQALVETPTYEPLQATVLSTSAKVIPLPRPLENSFNLDQGIIEKLFIKPVKLIVLSRPHNPSGKDIPIDTLYWLGERAGEIGAYVLVDEVYLDFLPEERRKPAAAIHPRLLSTASLTKVYGLGSLRIGWGIGPKEIIWNCWRINNVLGVIPPVIPDQIALELYRNGGIERIGAWARRRAAENLSLVEEFIAERDDLVWVKPDAGIIAFLWLKNYHHSAGFVRCLMDKFRTAVMPGSEFDLPHGFRLGFGGPHNTVKEGLRRIGLALSEGFYE